MAEAGVLGWGLNMAGCILWADVQASAEEGVPTQPAFGESSGGHLG